MIAQDPSVPDISSKFESSFPTELECVNLLLRIRLDKQKSLCSKCVNINYEIMYRWKKNSSKCKKCRKETAFSYGTIFYRSKLGLRMWLQLIWIWCYLPLSSNSFNSVQLSQILSRTQSTVYDSLSLLRANSIPPISRKLQGRVEMDLLIVERGSLCHYKYPGKTSWYILIAVQAGENNVGNVRMIALKNITDSAYNDFLGEYIKFRDSNIDSKVTIRGDRLHKQLNPSIEVDEFKTKSLNTYSSLAQVNCVANALNEFLLIFHGAILQPSDSTKKSNIHNYLKEFCWRWNNRNRNTKSEKLDIFEEVVACSVQEIA